LDAPLHVAQSFPSNGLSNASPNSIIIQAGGTLAGGPDAGAAA